MSAPENVGMAGNRVQRVEQIVGDREVEGRRTSTTVLGVRLVWHQWGDRCNPPLLLLHGGSGSWTHWLRNIAALAKHFWLIVPDLPGFGESALPPGPHSADQLAELIGFGLDQIVDPKQALDVATFSFGGVVAGHFAAMRPSRVHSLALAGAVGLGLSRRERPKFLRVDADLPLLDRWDLQAENLLAYMISDRSRVDDMAKHLQDKNVRQARLRSSILTSKETLGPIMRELDVPIVMAWGDADSIYAGKSRDDRIKLAEGLRQNGGVHFIKDAGHWAPFEQPEAYVAWLLEWLRGKGNNA